MFEGDEDNENDQKDNNKKDDVDFNDKTGE